MPVTVQQEDNQCLVMRVSGVLKKSELEAAQAAVLKSWGPGTHAKILIVVENFGGWEKNPDWGDLSFYIEHGEKIEKIAVVGDPKWQTEVMMFLGAGIRPMPIQFFTPEQATQARLWLTNP